jgi:hypothetical protein
VNWYLFNAVFCTCLFTFTLGYVIGFEQGRAREKEKGE